GGTRGAGLAVKIASGIFGQSKTRGEMEVLAGPRLTAPFLRVFVAMGIDDDSPLPVHPRQQPLVGAFDPLLSDPSADVVVPLSGLDLLGARLRQIAENVRGLGTARVEPALGDRDRELRILRSMRLDRGDLLDSEILGDRNRQELGISQPPFDASAHLFAGELQDPDREIVRSVQIARLPAIEM